MWISETYIPTGRERQDRGVSDPTLHAAPDSQGAKFAYTETLAPLLPMASRMRAFSGRPPDDALGSDPENRAVLEAHRAVLGVLPPQAGDRHGMLPSAGADYLRRAKHQRVPKAPPVFVVLVHNERHMRVDLDISNPAESARRDPFRLLVYRAEEDALIKGKAHGDNVGPAVPVGGRQSRDTGAP